MTERPRAVFLDRDGTLIEERDYLADPDDLRLYPGVGPALLRLREAGYLLVCVTNQSGVARGYFDEVAVARVHERLHADLARDGVALDLVLYAPYHPDHAALPGWDPTWRKPGDGMYRAALARLDVDPARSWCVGDAVRDLRGGASAGVENHLLVRTGHGERSLEETPPSERDWFGVVDDLVAAVEQILSAEPAQGR